jgi:tetratricopeptide (TPR) repeat protein
MRRTHSNNWRTGSTAFRGPGALRTGYALLAGLLISGCTAIEPEGSYRANRPVGPQASESDRPANNTFASLESAAPSDSESTGAPAPNMYSGSYLAGLHAGTVQDTRAAADFFAEALERDPGNVTLLRRTFILMLTDGRIDETLALLNQYNIEDARGSVGRITQYLDKLKKNDWLAARAELEGMSRIGFDALFVPLADAWALAGAGRTDEAIEAVREIDDKPAFVPFTNYHIAMLYDLGGQSEGAEEAYKIAVKSESVRSFRMIDAYGRFLERQGRPDEAKALYAKSLKHLVNNPVLLKAMDRIEKGTKPDRLVNRPEEGFSEALYTAASALSQDRAHESATIYLQLAVFARPDFELAYLLLARQFESAGRWQDALNQYQKIDTNGALGWETQFQLAHSLERLDRLDEAVTLLRAMARSRTDDPAPAVLLGDLYRAREMYQEAALEYDNALGRIKAFEPAHWILYYSRGVAYERTERWELAEADFQKALDLEPDQPLVLNYLGYSWIEKGRNIHKAREMVEKAVSLRPNDGYVVDSLGWVLYKLGKYSESVPLLERAVELRPQDPTINDHLGDAFWKVGRQIEARFQWRHALVFNPDEEQAKTLRAKLLNGLVADNAGS